MAAKCDLGQICDGPVAEKFHTTILHVCAKFHAFITKGTIHFYICCTIISSCGTGVTFYRPTLKKHRSIKKDIYLYTSLYGGPGRGP